MGRPTARPLRESVTGGRHRQLPRSWWRDGVLYQIYPRSFADSDGDGVGDLRGIIARLDHLEWLGVDGIWLNPTMPSPNDDWGYDVADYCGVHPDLGTLEDLDDARRGGRASAASASLLDLVPNHTSDRHPWFQDALSSRSTRATATSTCGRDPAETAPPAEQLAVELRRLGLDVARADRPVLPQQLPAHPARPQLVEPGGARSVRRVLRFWFDRGIAGFRIDVCHAIVKDRELRDDPRADARGPPRAAAPARAQAGVLA